MANFSDCIQTTKTTVRAWSCFGDLRSVIILRDVRGKIRLFLECSSSANSSVIQDALLSLKNALSTALGNYWGDKVYSDCGSQNPLEKSLFDQANRLKILDDTDAGGLSWYIIDRAIAKKAWIECNGSQRPMWSFDDACHNKHPKIVTFYSFKGGMGRTTALAAAMLQLAKCGKNVLAVDTDIEAPGLASLFFPESQIQKGTIDYLLESAIDERPDMSDYIRPITDVTLINDFPGQIFVIAAGKQDQDSHYLEKLSRIDCQETNSGSLRAGIEHLLNDAVNELARSSINIDYILLDARAGFHDLGGIVTTQVPHGVVLFGKDSKQSWCGLKQVVYSIAHTQPSEDLPWIAIVNSGCGVSGTISQSEKDSFLSKSYDIFQGYYSLQGDILPALGAVDEAHSPLYIPFHSLLTKDIQLYLADSDNDTLVTFRDVLMSEPYQLLINRIIKWFDM